MNKTILVFSSDEQGSHTAGASPFAMHQFGARKGLPEGLQGHAYGIPTRDSLSAPLPQKIIENSIRRFMRFAARHPDALFEIAPLTINLPEDTQAAIESMLVSAPVNCLCLTAPRRQAHPTGHRNTPASITV